VVKVALVQVLRQQLSDLVFLLSEITLHVDEGGVHPFEWMSEIDRPNSYNLSLLVHQEHLSYAAPNAVVDLRALVLDYALAKTT
jgi:hypothetical protein